MTETPLPVNQAPEVSGVWILLKILIFLLLIPGLLVIAVKLLTA